MDTADVVIVGTGHGGAQAAISLRRHGFTGSILMIGREPDLPYRRPALSKEYLARAKPLDRMLIRPALFWKKRAIRMSLGVEVVSVDPADKVVTQSNGARVGYGFLIWAAGGDPRPLGHDQAHFVGVHAVRTRGDVDRLMVQLDAGARRIAVIGGGCRGLEAAAALTSSGCSVVLLEAQPRVLSRATGNQLSQFYQAKHRAHGVDLRTNMLVESIVGEVGHVTGVRMADGSTVAAEIVIVAIGIVPCTAPLLEAGAAVQDGVLVDAYCRTSLPDIYAVGDCAAQASEFAEGEVVRLESVENAQNMATSVAKSICGSPAVCTTLPSFWSEQYDLKLQCAGLAAYHDMSMLTGDQAEGRFSVLYWHEGRLSAIDCVNSPGAFAKGRALIQERADIVPPLPYPVKT